MHSCGSLPQYMRSFTADFFGIEFLYILAKGLEPQDYRFSYQIKMPYTEKLGVFEQTKIDADERITSKGPVNHFDDSKTSKYAAIWNFQSLLSQAVLENATFAAFWSRAYLSQGLLVAVHLSADGQS